LAFFGALLPPSLFYLGMPEEAVWSIVSIVLSLAIFGELLTSLLVNERLCRARDRSPNPNVWRVTIPAIALVALALLLSGLHLLLRPELGVYYVGLVSLLGVACVAFVLFLRYPAAPTR
jgi:hypothetical protein